MPSSKLQQLHHSAIARTRLAPLLTFLNHSTAPRHTPPTQTTGNSQQPTHQNPQSGQVAVIVLLLMVVLLTIGLSLASRVTQDIFLTQQQSDSARVFNAAESGAEDALSQDFSTITTPQTGTGTLGNQIVYNYTIIPSQVLERDLKEGDTATVNVNNTPGNITVEWGKESGCVNSYLIISTYFEEGGQTKVRHDAIAPNGCTRGDNFEETTNQSPPYRSSYDVAGIDNTVLFVRIKAVYNDTSLRVTGLNLPQQYLVRSAASNPDGTEQRTVEVTRGVSAAPAFMDYSLYTTGSIQKNE